jgi:hypothetical protein
MGQAFRDLQVWQRAIQLTVVIYRLTQGFPREEVFGLSSQARRSAVSVPSNIAEGQGRLTVGEFRQFLVSPAVQIMNCKPNWKLHGHSSLAIQI